MALVFEQSRGRPGIGIRVKFVHKDKAIIGKITNFVFDPHFSAKEVSAYEVFARGVKVNWIKCEIVKLKK